MKQVLDVKHKVEADEAPLEAISPALKLSAFAQNPELLK